MKNESGRERDTNSRWKTSTSLFFFFSPQQARKADRAPRLGGNSRSGKKKGCGGHKTQRANKTPAPELREAKLTLGHVISWESLAAVNETTELPHLSGALGRSSSPMGTYRPDEPPAMVVQFPRRRVELGEKTGESTKTQTVLSFILSF